MTPLGTDISLLSRYLASSSGYGHRDCESRYSTYSYPGGDRCSSYSPRPSAYRERDNARTHHEPGRRKRGFRKCTERTSHARSPSFATRDYHQEQKYKEPAGSRSPRSAKPASQYARDDSYASGRVSPASSQEDFKGEDTH